MPRPEPEPEPEPPRKPEASLPCAGWVDRQLPWLLPLFCVPCCCFRADRDSTCHPDCVAAPFDLLGERVYSRALAVVTFASFTWRAFLSYFVLLTGTDPTAFALCNTTGGVEFSGDENLEALQLLSAVIDVAQGGLLAFPLATLIGLGNSRWHGRCWAFIAPVAAMLAWSTGWSTLRFCGQQWVAQGEEGGFALFAGGASNIVSSAFYLVQLLLLLQLLGSRLRRCGGDGRHCAPREFSEPLHPMPPVSPGTEALRGRRPSAELSAGLLQHAEVHTDVSKPPAAAGQQADEGKPRPIPLRFWIAITLSSTVVAYLATMGILYGVFLTDRLREWAQSTGTSITEAQTFVATSLLPIFPGNASLQYLVDLLGFADDGVATVLDNFSAVRPALFCGMVCGVLNELAWKVSAWRKLKAFAALPPAERAATIARYDFYWGFYFISFATFNAAAAFIIVSSFCSLLFFTIFAPILREQLWVTLFLSSGLGAIIAGSIMRKVLFTGVVATRTTVRYTRLFIWMDFWYSFTLGPVSAATTVLLRYLALLCCSISSLARLDEPLILPELGRLGLDVWEPGFAAWGGMLKGHYRKDASALKDGGGRSDDLGAYSDEAAVLGAAVLAM